jgi:peptidoglycan/LPS O-acetylase OafA/YrhL
MTSRHSRLSAAKATASKATHFQPHIQGLRAIAVILVVFYHFWPGRLGGGYIGVDIFFVISGFLITGQLARELDRTGTIRLPAFWGKRVRRLLPASITVLVFCTLATIFILPLSGLVDSLKEILASTFYFENWSLAAGSVDYLGAHSATMVQHYWSLSLEEQFYVFWPLLLLGATWVGVKLFTRRRWVPMVALVVIVSVLSLIASVLYTNTNPAEAFFVTFTRVWEFGAGALLALLPKWRPRGAWWPNILGYGGLAVILVTAYEYNAQSAFPGYLAIFPVLGAAAIIASDRAKNWWDIGRVLGGPPQRFIGDISYSVYLWHWPLIIIAPYIPGWGLTGWNRIALFIVSFVLGWLTKKFIEDPARQWRFLTKRKPRFSYAFMVSLMAISSLLVGVAFAVNNPKYEAAASQLQQINANPPACFGAMASPSCQNPKLADSVIPSAGFGNADQPDHAGCFVELNESNVVSCQFGSTAPNAPRVALIGDSHAYQYIDTMIDLANKNGWALTTYLKGACPWNAAPIGGPSVAFTDSCQTWLANLKTVLAKQPRYDAIFASSLADTPYQVSSASQISAGFVTAWKQAKGAPIVTIVDNPDFLDDPNKCLRVSPAADCGEPRDQVLKKVDPVVAAAKTADATLMNLTDKYCDATTCFAVVGGANIYRDQDHLTVTWTLTMQTVIGNAIEKALARS